MSHDRDEWHSPPKKTASWLASLIARGSLVPGIDAAIAKHGTHQVSEVTCMDGMLSQALQHDMHASIAASNATSCVSPTSSCHP